MKLNEQLEHYRGQINFSNFRIDVGTAIDAPNSAHWLLEDSTTTVLGIEPNITNTNILRKGSHKKPKFNYLSVDESAIYNNGNLIMKYSPERFALLERVAVDDVVGVIEQDFYCTAEANTGCSSLYKPTKALGIDVERVDKVEVTSLEYYILDHLGFPSDGHIMFVKTDTQGKDFDVVKSLRKYLSKVIALKCEYNTKDQYEVKSDPKTFVQFMTNNNFSLVGYTEYDFFFMNKTFLPATLFNLPSE